MASTSPFSPHHCHADTTCICHAFLCIYTACSGRLACRVKHECLCLQKTICLEPTAPCLTCGLKCCSSGQQQQNTTNSNRLICCQLGCGFYEVAIQEPRVLCGIAEHILCLRLVGSFPFHPGDYLNEPRCAYYCVQCYPILDVAAPAPPCPILGDKSPGGSQKPVRALTMEDRPPRQQSEETFLVIQEEDICKPISDSFHNYALSVFHNI